MWLTRYRLNLTRAVSCLAGANVCLDRASLLALDINVTRDREAPSRAILESTRGNSSALSHAILVNLRIYV